MSASCLGARADYNRERLGKSSKHMAMHSTGQSTTWTASASAEGRWAAAASLLQGWHPAAAPGVGVDAGVLLLCSARKVSAALCGGEAEGGLHLPLSLSTQPPAWSVASPQSMPEPSAGQVLNF